MLGARQGGALGCPFFLVQGGCGNCVEEVGMWTKVWTNAPMHQCPLWLREVGSRRLKT